jgi:hypothetical protein
MAKPIVHKSGYGAKRTYCGLPLIRVHDTILNSDVTCKRCKKILKLRG